MLLNNLLINFTYLLIVKYFCYVCQADKTLGFVWRIMNVDHFKHMSYAAVSLSTVLCYTFTSMLTMRNQELNKSVLILFRLIQKKIHYGLWNQC